MMEAFFLRAMLGAIGVAVMSGPIGCFVVWRRMAYFGSALAHAALLGVALGLLLEINLTIAILGFCVTLAVMLLTLERQRLLPSDTLLGILAHSTLAIGLVVVAFMEHLRLDLMGYLFGDVLAVGPYDLWLILALTIGVLGVIFFLWRPLLSASVSEDLAAVEGVAVARIRLVFVLTLAVVIAIGMKIVGILLIISLLIIPPATARRFATTPERMAVFAVLVGVASVVAGLFASLSWDLPAGPAIVVAATGFFALSLLMPRALAEGR